MPHMPVWNHVSPLLCFFAPLAAFAAAPVLPSDMATSTNDLQRAVWACEAGGQASSKDMRFFLGLVENTPAQAEKPPLVLLGRKLSGFGQISNDHGWLNIRFDCSLRPDLMQAEAFKFTILSPAQLTDAPPPQPSPAPPNAAKWSVTGTTAPQLVHGNGKAEDFSASCVRASRLITLDLAHSLPRLREGNFMTVSLTDGRNSALYIAQIGAGNTLSPRFTLPADDPLANWLGKAMSLHINLGGEFAYDVSQQGSGQAIAAFLQACR